MKCFSQSNFIMLFFTSVPLGNICTLTFQESLTRKIYYLAIKYACTSVLIHPLEQIQSKETQGCSSYSTLSDRKKYHFITLITSSGRAVITASTDNAVYTNIRVSQKSHVLPYHKCSSEKLYTGSKSKSWGKITLKNLINN